MFENTPYFLEWALLFPDTVHEFLAAEANRTDLIRWAIKLTRLSGLLSTEDERMIADAEQELNFVPRKHDYRNPYSIFQVGENPFVFSSGGSVQITIYQKRISSVDSYCFFQLLRLGNPEFIQLPRGLCEYFPIIDLLRPLRTLKTFGSFLLDDHPDQLLRSKHCISHHRLR